MATARPPRSPSQPPPALPPGTPPIAIRQELVEVLRRDLVGPGPGTDDPLASEELPMSPDRWYLTGFLIPFQAPEDVRSDAQSDDEVDAVGDDDEEETATPEQRSARKAYFPSSLGASVLVGPQTTTIGVTISWGDYQPVGDPAADPADLDGAPRAQERGRRGRDEPWRRLPRQARLSLDLEGPGEPQEVPGSDGLRVVTLLRAVPPGTRRHLQGARALSVFLVNDRQPTTNRAESFVFQAQLALDCAEGFLPRPSARAGNALDADEQIAELQYRDTWEYAVGHGASTDAPVVDGRCRRVTTTWLPTEEVHKVVPGEVTGLTREMEGLAAAGSPGALVAMLSALPAAYQTWLEGQAATSVGAEHQEALDQLMSEAHVARQRIADGIALLGSEPEVYEAFVLANKAMAKQSRARSPERVPTWRTFQLAFLLMNLRSMHDPAHVERREVDLLFFPTGGGKTEAYLGLAAFTLVLRRLRHPGHEGAGVSVVMRYTLRLLTLDQLGRAAALICALELERRVNPRLGPWPFEIGLWVGRSATPNRMGQQGDNDPNTARKRTQDYQRAPGKPKPLPLEGCPWCQAPFGQSSFRLTPNQNTPTNLVVQCVNPRCPFSQGTPLPIVSVDEPLYRRLPCFIIATVDKYAQLPWVGQTGTLFGKVTHRTNDGFFGPCDRVPPGAQALAQGLPPPDLIIQDELHLISGPLGTMVGLYETAIDALCERTADGHTMGPKVVASTATVRRAEAQIRAIFGRPGVRVFPPPGPDRNDSFFARTVPPSEKNARRYLGVAAPGRGLKVAFLRVTLALLGASQRLYDQAGGKGLRGKNPVDPYMTLLAYFGSLRELGGTRRIVEDEVRSRARAYHTRARPGMTAEFSTREVREPVELTSREPTARVAESKDRLSRPVSDQERVDVALATNMISVGLDITRLGLMVVYGQPKTTSEYIQATSRVGRDDLLPGLVVTLLNVHKPRDRSHHERFAYYHQTFYRSVEATSVTPFSPRAIDRGIAAITVALARLGHAPMTPALGTMSVNQQRPRLDPIPELIAQRAANHDGSLSPSEQSALRSDVKARVVGLLDSWEARVMDAINNGATVQYQREVAGPPPLLRDPLDPKLRHEPELRKFKAQRSLRDVEPSVNLKLKTLNGQPIEEG